MPMVEANYKFYLSFENSLCRDYVTEKFWKVLMYDVVPIVYGAANYSLLAPAKSFINVQGSTFIRLHFAKKF
jgi:alpha-1,3-fucosyltransferase